MSNNRYTFTQPKYALFRWLTNPGRGISPALGVLLLGELFSSPGAVIAGVVNGLVLNSAALIMCRGHIFAFFIVFDFALASARIAVARHAGACAARGQATPTDLYLATGLAWCALQGAMGFAALQTNVLAVQLLAATTVMSYIGPICARNYAAPRYAFLLVCLCTLPFVAGAVATGERRLLVLPLQTPLFLFAISTIIKRFQAMAVTNLQAEQGSYNRARHDSLTGLLNRFGLMEMLDVKALSDRFTLFYLDLDGFKPINDTFGHASGDKVLQAVGARLQSIVRPGDIVSRLGGDEFVIVAADMSPSEGDAYADAIIRRISDEPYQVDAIGPLKIGISIGSVCSPDNALSPDEMHRAADAALYEAKAAGRGIHRRFGSYAAARVAA